MKARELLNIGFKQGPLIGLALRVCKEADMTALEVRVAVKMLFIDPESWMENENFKELAIALHEQRNPPRPKYDFTTRSFMEWGSEFIDDNTRKQMAYAMALPITVKGVLMPDAHLGYGLPVGGVLATEGAVIPYAVGVDIACRMKLSVLPIEDTEFSPKFVQEMIRNIEKNTRFGMGCSFDIGDQREHYVMDMDWGVTPITKKLKDLAWRQLGTSGSGNHFVDVGVMTVDEEFDAGFYVVPAGKYVAILTHSGSRGPGAKVANYYTKLAESLHPGLPAEYKRLAWLDLGADGDEYWAAMSLMGEYASANHHCIHEHLLKEMKIEPLLQIENHHNFAWKERHNGKEVIVHRKGATPAGKGVFGIIPGSMATPGFLVVGKGSADSLNSTSHGAGRTMSRTAAKNSFTKHEVKKLLKERGVTLISGGLDESPGSYKDINDVMAAQSDLVEVKAQFDPKLVKMADDGTAED